MCLKDRISHKYTLSTLTLAVLAIGPGSLLATQIPFTMGGGFNIGNFSVAVNGPSGGNLNSCVIFYQGATPPTCTATENISSQMTLNAPSDPIFGTVNVTTGTILELPPNGGSPPETDSVTLNGYDFDLLEIVTPSYPSCAIAPQGQDCVVAGSPFVFNQVSSDAVDVTLIENLCGYVDGSSPGTNCITGTPYEANLTSHFVNFIDSGTYGTTYPATITNLLTIIGMGGTVTDSISGNYQPGFVPEPMTFVLLGSGLIALSMLGRRYRRR